MHLRKQNVRFVLAALFLAVSDKSAVLAEPPGKPLAPLGRVVDLNVGQSQAVELSNGKSVTVKLIDLRERRDPIREAVRETIVKVEVDGRGIELVSGNYNLPKTVGDVQIDCSITKGYNSNGSPEFWALDKDARLRLWPAGSPLLQPGTFAYPARQRWFAGLTQMANEPAYVDGGERPQTKKIYYHSGLDIGGCEGMVEVIAATDGLVVSSGLEVLAEHRQNTPVSPRYDVVYLLDARGWYYRYSHLKEIDATVKPGRHLKLGDRIGSLGKEGGSGGWSHLHFEIKSRQPSGRWGTEEGYAYLWEAYLRQFQPQVIAVARPHHVIWAGEQVKLDGSKSWGAAGGLVHRWRFHDGSLGLGASVMRSYSQPGSYSEVLEVTDGKGNVAYDFAIVQVLDREHPDRIPPTIHPACSPTEGIRVGDEVTFKVRTFRTTDGSEVWDFGDGTPTVEVHSDGNVRQLDPNGYAVTTHRFAKPGHFLVRVERANGWGMKAIGHLAVLVAERAADDEPVAWVEPMKKVHARFSGKPGTLALFGDSISVSLAFWAPLRGEPKDMPPEMAAAHAIVKAHQKPECWAEWRGPQYGNQGRMTIRWAHENVDAWLKAHNPEAAVLMFGTNDLGEVPLEEFERKTAEVVEHCLANGTVVLLTTLPPRSGMLEKSMQFAEAVRRVAKAKQTPLIDYHAEILKRRPDDWDGALPQFRNTPGSEYEVPTLIARDGVHPSNPQAHRDFSAESLKRNGFALRNYLTLLAYAEVVQKLFAKDAKAPSESECAEADPPRETALGKVAAGMKPGEWAELKTENIAPTLRAKGNSGAIFGYNEGAAWDPSSRQLLYLGGDHNDPARFVTYSDDTNAWKIMPQPEWLGSGTTHGYDHNAIDAGRGLFYYRPFSSRGGLIHRYEIATGQWSPLPRIDTQEYLACCTGLAWFPELDALVFANGGGGKGHVFLFTPKDQKWTMLAGDLPMGVYHNFAEYSPLHKVVIFGGGNGSRDLYKLDAAGKVTTLKQAPIGIGTMQTIVTVDPVGGDFLVFSKGGSFYVYEVATDTWKPQTGEVPIFSPTRVADNKVWHVTAAPVSTYGVTLFAKYYHADPPQAWVYLYRHR